MFPIILACCLPSSHVTSSGSALWFLVTTTVGYLISIITGDGLLFTVFGCLLSAVSTCLLSFVANSDLLFAVSSCFLFFIASDGLLSAIFGYFLSFVASSGLFFAVSGSSPLSPIPFTSSQALFLLCTPFYTRHFSLPSPLLIYSFLPFLPTLIARNLTLHIRKRLFDQAFITQRPIVSI